MRREIKIAQTDRFLDFNERDVLTSAGSVSAARMKVVTADRFAEVDAGRRAQEVERTALQDQDDLRELLAIDRPSEPDDDP